ncbi:MAG: outer membrane lipoprotein-sorting protein [Chitinispirillaceae bacterium]|nr:outer membrane lipoprotein-sorting protein [Chitinispirillaceae bacterium]
MRFLVIIVFCFTTVAVAQEKLTALEIVNRAQDVLRVKGVQAVSVLRIIDEKGRERIRKIKQVTKIYDNGETEKKLIRFIEPADVKGTGLLTFDYNSKEDDLWVYVPTLRKVRRIVSSEKSKSFFGSEFTYADMSPPSPDDFDFKLLGEEKVGDVLCYKVEWKPKNDDVAEENGFSRRITFSGKDNFVVRKSIYYDMDGELYKELIVHEIKELDTKNHKFRYMNSEAINKQNGRRSIFVNEKIEFKPDVDDKYFTTGYLERE